MEGVDVLLITDKAKREQALEAILAANSAQLGDAGVYVGALVSGVADVDAITLSMAELSRGNGELSDSTAANAIVLAAASNALVKGGLVWVGAAPSMRKWVVPAVAGSIVLSVTTTFLV